jgi:hypothetical protein
MHEANNDIPSTTDMSRRKLGRLALYTAPAMVALLTSAQAVMASTGSQDGNSQVWNKQAPTKLGPSVQEA